MKLHRRIAGIAAAVVLGLGMFSPVSEAAPTGNIVTFGDSYTSNPDQARNFLRFIPQMTEGYPSKAGCLQAPDNWPRLLGEKTGREIADWSCTGSNSQRVLGSIESAIQAGDVRNDSTVIIAVGINDYWPFGVTGKGNFFDPAQVRAGYIERMHIASDMIRAAAPSAKIILAGSLPTVGRVSAQFCAVNVVPNQPAGFPFPLLRDVENWNRDNQITAAQETGMQYLDMFPSSEGHDTCAPDQDRYIAGVIDTTTPSFHMVFHPSFAGSDNVARQLAPVV